jgi:cytochrome b561
MEPIERYPARSIALHWLVVLVLAATFPLGMALSRAPDGWGDTLYRLHWSFGLLALALAFLRTANRLIGGAPAPHPGLTRLESVLSNLVHKALYLLLLLAPLLGWLGKSAYGGPITVFGLFDMPALLPPSEALAKTFLGAHKIVVKLLMACIVLHVAGALNHLFIKRDGLLLRMMPRRKAG